MKHILPALVAAFLLAALALPGAHAQVDTPPPLTALPSPGIATDAPQLADPTFPARLEDEGDLTNAILEWKRIAHTTADIRLQDKALWRVAQLYRQLGNHEAALSAFENYGETFPKSHRTPEALYFMSLSADAINPGRGDIFRDRLRLFADTEWKNAADYAWLWHLARAGQDDLPQIGGKLGAELRDRLADAPAQVPDRAWTATLLSALPGLGHAWLGDHRTGLTAFVINLIFIAALITALRRRMWGFAGAFGLAAAILYVGTMFSAHSLAYREALEHRLDLMRGWVDMQPRDPQPTGGSTVLGPQTRYIPPMQTPLWFFRNVIGQFDGARGNGHPVNSLYAKQAFDRFGPALGSLMSVDRLLRDWREAATAPVRVSADGRARYIDPLARNTFWLERSHDS